MPQRQLSTEAQAMENETEIMMENAPSATAAAGENKPPPADEVDFTGATPSTSQPLRSQDTVEGRLRTFKNWKVSFLSALEMPQRQLSTESQAVENETEIMMEDAPSATAEAEENKPPPADVVDFTGATPSTSQPLRSLDTVEGRLRTFKDWKVSFLSALELAAAGFFFLNRDDAVECVYCGVVISQWQEGDKAMEEHRKWAPECDFANPGQRLCVDAVSYDTCRPFDPPVAGRRQPQRPRARSEVTPVTARQPTWPQYCARADRLATYRDWPPSIPVKPDALSDAGFFYTGVGDRTTCYYCGSGLRDWEAGDDPWLEHELWFPGCWHVLLHRGNAFIEVVAEQRDALIAAKKNPREALKVALAESAESKPRDVAPADEVGESSGTEEKRLCKICYQNEMSVVFLPCGHIVACVDCALSCHYCPLCREPFQNVARVYLP